MFGALAAFAMFSQALSGCSGGGANGMPADPLQSGTLSLTLGAPASSSSAAATSSAAKERRQFLSPSAQSVKVAVTGVPTAVVANVASGSPNCTGSGPTRTCTIDVSAPSGSVTFTVTLYDAPGATGNKLGTGTATQTIVKGSPFTVAIGVLGNVATVQLLAATTEFTAGTAATTPLTVNAYDADGNLISGTYLVPLTLTNSDATGTFTLSATSVTASGAAITIHYNGTGTATGTTISASGTGIPTSSIKPQTLSVGNAPLTYYTYPLPADSVPNQFAPGPDHNMWYASTNTQAAGRIALPSHTITEFQLPTDPVNGQPSYGLGITGASDGNLYATAAQCSIFRVSTAGVVSLLVSMPTCPEPAFLTQGPDGNLWVLLLTSAVARVPLSGAAPTIFPLPTAGAIAYNSHITTGPDGALWITEKLANKIARITTSGSITEYPVSPGTYPQGLVSAPDGNLWFTEPGTSAMGKMTTSGALTEYPIGNPSVPDAGLTLGSDLNLYFSGSPYSGKTNLLGATTLFYVGGPGGDTNGEGDSVATGSDGNAYTVLGTGVPSQPYELLEIPPQ
jgi:streptogramin lyase